MFMLEQLFLRLYATKGDTRNESSQNSLRTSAILISGNHQRRSTHSLPLKPLWLLRKRGEIVRSPYICLSFYHLQSTFWITLHVQTHNQCWGARGRVAEGKGITGPGTLPKDHLPHVLSHPAMSSLPNHIQTELLTFRCLLASFSWGSPFMLVFVPKSFLPPSPYFLSGCRISLTCASVIHIGLQIPPPKCLHPTIGLLPWGWQHCVCSPADVTFISLY